MIRKPVKRWFNETYGKDYARSTGECFDLGASVAKTREELLHEAKFGDDIEMALAVNLLVHGRGELLLRVHEGLHEVL